MWPVWKNPAQIYTRNTIAFKTFFWQSASTFKQCKNARDKVKQGSIKGTQLKANINCQSVDLFHSDLTWQGNPWTWWPHLLSSAPPHWRKEPKQLTKKINPLMTINKLINLEPNQLTKKINPITRINLRCCKSNENKKINKTRNPFTRISQLGKLLPLVFNSLCTKLLTWSHKIYHGLLFSGRYQTR